MLQHSKSYGGTNKKISDFIIAGTKKGGMTALRGKLIHCSLGHWMSLASCCDKVIKILTYFSIQSGILVQHPSMIASKQFGPDYFDQTLMKYLWRQHNATTNNIQPSWIDDIQKNYWESTFHPHALAEAESGMFFFEKNSILPCRSRCPLADFNDMYMETQNCYHASVPSGSSLLALQSGKGEIMSQGTRIWICC